MFIVLKPFLTISQQESDFIVIGHYSHHRIKINGDGLSNLAEYNKLKEGIELTDKEFKELLITSLFYRRLQNLELIDIYVDKIEYSQSRRLSFYSLFSNKPFSLLNELKNLTITIIGCGGLGSRLAVELSASGFRNFILVDNDKLEDSNLERMFWFSKSDVGKYKTLLTKEFLESRYEDIKIKTYEMRFSQITDKIDFGFLSIFSADDDNGFFLNGNKEKLQQHNGKSIFCGYAESLAFAGPFYNSPREILFENKNNKIKDSLIPPSVGYINSLIAGVVINDIFLLVTGKEPLLSNRKWIYNILTGHTTLMRLT